MKGKLLSVFLAGFCFTISSAQDCGPKLQTARDYKKKNNYEMAIKYYRMVMDDCGDYDGKVKEELSECKKMISPPKPSGLHVPVKQPSTGSISNVEPYFDASGDCLNETNIIRVSLNDWSFLVDESCQDWLKVERSGNSLIVTCRDNPDKEKRVGEIFVLGEINEQIVVTQYGATSSKSSAQTNYKAKPLLLQKPKKNNQSFAKIMNQAAEGRIKAEVNSERTKEAANVRERTEIMDISHALSSTKILFDRNKDIPKIDDSNDNINKTVQILKKYSNLKLIVEGYTDGLGSEEYNRDLALRRANRVRELFIQKGVSPDQIETVSYTINDPQNRQNITDHNEENNAAIFRIVKR